MKLGSTPYLSYELELGRSRPWGFGEDTLFATPPGRVQQLSERGTEGFEQVGQPLSRLPQIAFRK